MTTETHPERRTVVVAARLTPDAAAALRALAARGDRTVSHELSRAVRAHLALNRMETR